MNFTEIDNSGVVNANFNGHWKQTVIFVNEKNEKYRITINHTSSVSILWKWNEIHGWNFIVEKSTIRDFNIDSAYKSSERISQTIYMPIIVALKKLAENF